MTDITTIELDLNEETLQVTLGLPVSNADGFAEFDEVIDMGDDTLPDYLVRAARDLTQAALRSVRERQSVRGEPPCVTCTGACCMLDNIRVTEHDVQRMLAAGVDVSESVIAYYAGGEDWTGHVGVFQKVPYDPEVAAAVHLRGGGDIAKESSGQRTACPHLRATGCSIYEHRPILCRQFSPWSCEDFEPDPTKDAGRVKLRVVQ